MYKYRDASEEEGNNNYQLNQYNTIHVLFYLSPPTSRAHASYPELQLLQSFPKSSSIAAYPKL
jgi:hypothetical protein